MQKHLLDTNVASLLGSGDDEYRTFFDRFYRLADDDIVMVSVITLYEINYGLKNSQNKKQQEEIRKNLELIQKYFEIVPLDIREMEIYADLKVLYKYHTGINKTSMKKNDLDILIASSAIATGATLVSRDAIFATLSEIEPKLKWENWL